jgi:hypothetical protein
VVAVSAAEHEEERVGRAATGVELVGRGAPGPFCC